MNIVEEVKSLNLPFGEYVIVGSGPMAVRNMRNYKDIDVLVTKDLYQRLSTTNGWKIIILPGLLGDREVAKNGECEAGIDLWFGDYKPDTETLIKNAEIIQGIPFLPLEELIKFKKAMGRPKDLADIKLIEQYLSKNE